jgi:glycosyltransferase involved in cell wall biosynthesis
MVLLNKEQLPRLRVLHVVDDFSTANTGVTATVRQLVQWQAGCFDWVGVHAVGDVNLPTPHGVELLQSPSHRFTPRWRYPVGGAKALLQLIRSHRVTHLHLHELWRGGYVAGMQAARSTGLPVILSAHGSTAPWALYGQGCSKGIKKRVYWNCFARSLLAPQVALHAITPLEARHMASFFDRRVQLVVPNAIVLPDPVPPAVALRKRFVFLGRLHPVKGIDALIEAFSAAGLDDTWELVIAGPEEMPHYATQLKARAAASAKTGRIHFVGPVNGEDKQSLLASAWAVVVPSHTEVIGMVNLEAGSLATPSITTAATGLEEWNESGGILLQDHTGLRSALEAAAAWSQAERRARGCRIRKYITEHYSMEAVGQQWLQQYLLLSTFPSKGGLD